MLPLPREMSLMKQRFRDNISGFAFILISLFWLLAFSGIPLVYSATLSLHRFQLFGKSPFVGFANYVAILHDKLFWVSIRNTFYFMLLAIPARTVIALCLAAILVSTVRGASVFKTVFFIPVVVSTIAVAYIWQWVYAPDAGLLSFTLNAVGLRSPDWLGNPGWAMPAIALMRVWKDTGFVMVVYIAGLQGISRTFYEAATIDGATSIQKFLRITVPLLSPQTFFVIVMAIIGTFQIFSEIYVMTNGGPLNATTTVVWYLYQNAFVDLRMGLASAVAWIMFAIILFFTVIQFVLRRRWDYGTE